MPRHIHALTLGLWPADLVPMALDAPAAVIANRLAIARKLADRADEREVALRDIMVSDRITHYELRYVDRMLALIQHERSIAAALRRFHLRPTASHCAADSHPSSRAGIGGLHVRGWCEGPTVRGVAGPEPETESPVQSGAETAAWIAHAPGPR
jgi:hypothetical protein